MISHSKIQVNLPFKPSILNSYAFRSENNPDEIFLLDSGTSLSDTLSDLEQGLKKVDPKLNLESIAWIAPTHAHIDHLGGLQKIKERSGAKIIIHQDEYNYFVYNRPSKWIDDVFSQYGIPDTILDQFHTYSSYYEKYYDSFTPDEYLTGDEGKLPFIDELNFIKISGHTPYHIAIILENQKAIFTGDTILSKITPNLGFSSRLANPVKDYIETMTLLSEKYDSWTAYPGHQDIITNIKKRADIILFLLQERLENVEHFFQRKGAGLPSLVKSLYPIVWSDPIQRYLAV
ncbi:MAG: MBL fold metallo-hydrolase, partial [Candidatus Thorarchaeota archaeon]